MDVTSKQHWLRSREWLYHFGGDMIMKSYVPLWKPTKSTSRIQRVLFRYYISYCLPCENTCIVDIHCSLVYLCNTKRITVHSLVAILLLFTLSFIVEISNINTRNLIHIMIYTYVHHSFSSHSCVIKPYNDMKAC